MVSSSVFFSGGRGPVSFRSCEGGRGASQLPGCEGGRGVVVVAVVVVLSVFVLGGAGGQSASGAVKGE